MLLEEPVQEHVGRDDDSVAHVDNDLVERHHQVERDGEDSPGVEASLIQYQRQPRLSHDILFIIMKMLRNI